jgi:O-methyltransferase
VSGSGGPVSSGRMSDPGPDGNFLVRGVQRQLAGYEQFFYDAWVSQRVNGISGDYAEFGSWGANTMRTSYVGMRGAGLSRHMWAFDSWEGLPASEDPRDQHPGWGPGTSHGQGGVDAFHEACDRHGIPREAYTPVSGYYEESLPPRGTEGPPTDIALAYVDCNLYSSTVTVLEFLAPRMKHGMILAFDDYYCWSPTHVSGERAALREFARQHPEWNFERYKDVHRSGVSFVVEDASQLV